MALELVKVAVRSATKERDVPGVERLITTDAFGVVGDPAIDVVVEVMGGISPARDLVLEALRSGKPVVSANKELLANHGGELWDAASVAGVDLLFEASVAGGVPLIRALAGVAGRRAHPPRDGHRQRDDQLHPHPHGRFRRQLPGSLGRGPGPGLRRA